MGRTGGGVNSKVAGGSNSQTPRVLMQRGIAHRRRERLALLPQSLRCWSCALSKKLRGKREILEGREEDGDDGDEEEEEEEEGGGEATSLPPPPGS